MSVTVNLYSKKNNEIYRFLNSFNKNLISDKSSIEWTNIFENPIELADIIGVFIDNLEKYDITMWVSLDENFFINITKNNADKIIRYLYERYPY